MSPVRENLHTAFTSFHKVLAALPRWVLPPGLHLLHSLRSLFLALRQLPWCTHCLSPISDFSAGASPSLSRKRWSILLKKRLRHIIIVALNYLHGGICHRNFWEASAIEPFAAGTLSFCRWSKARATYHTMSWQCPNPP